MFPARLLSPLLAVMVLAACASDRSLGDSFGDTSADLTLRRLLLMDRTHNTNDVDITVFEGRLMLSGTVGSAEARRSVAATAERIVAIDEVLNELVVGPKTSWRQGTRDAIIDERLGAALLTDNGVISKNFQIAVSGGVVHLLGVAQTPEELERVVGHAKTIKGVQGVVSHVLFLRDPRRQL